MPISLIAAVAANGVIGRRGGLPWHLPADLRRFQSLTTGHHLIVGRATWESVGRPLRDRTFVVVTRSGAVGPSLPGLRIVRTLDDGLRAALAAGDGEPFVAGGAGIYREALERDRVDRVYLTRIARAYEGDTRFPEFDPRRWREVSREEREADAAADRPAFAFVTYERAGRPFGAAAEAVLSSPSVLDSSSREELG